MRQAGCQNGNMSAPGETIHSLTTYRRQHSLPRWRDGLQMIKTFPTQPANPERICWGCDKYCATDSMMCGNGSERAPHPFELFGENWHDWGHDFVVEPAKPSEPRQVGSLAVQFATLRKTSKQQVAERLKSLKK